MSIIDAPFFFQENKAKDLNDRIFTNTACFIFLKVGEFPFITCCENYRQAFYSLIMDSYVLFHDYGRKFLPSFLKATNTDEPSILSGLMKYRGLLAHSQFEPEFQTMDSFFRLLTSSALSSIEEFYEKILKVSDKNYKDAYTGLKEELDTFYNALSSVPKQSIKNKFCPSPNTKYLSDFRQSLNQSLIKSILQIHSGKEKPTYSKYCKDGRVEIQCFKRVQNDVMSRFLNGQYQTPDEIYPDFRKEVIKTVDPPQQLSAELLNSVDTR